jgi:hypothetical protein
MEGSGKLISSAYRAGEGSPWHTLRTDLDGSLLSSQEAGGFVGATVGLYARLLASPKPANEASPPSSASSAPAQRAVPGQLGVIKPLALAAVPLTTPWAANFADGTPALDASKGFTAKDPITTGVGSDSGFIQTFAGNGQVLKGVAFCFASTSAPRADAKFAVDILDYGDADPVQSPSAINTGVPVLATAEFTWSSSSEPRQYYFDLAAANVRLTHGRRYGVALRFPGARGPHAIHRSTVDALPGGRLALGKPGAYIYDFAGGDRDAHFAVYTARH